MGSFVIGFVLGFNGVLSGSDCDGCFSSLSIESAESRSFSEATALGLRLNNLESTSELAPER
jgi:hypothetical protein